MPDHQEGCGFIRYTVHVIMRDSVAREKRSPIPPTIHWDVDESQARRISKWVCHMNAKILYSFCHIILKWKYTFIANNDKLEILKLSL